MSKPTTSAEKKKIFDEIRPDKEHLKDCCHSAKWLMLLGSKTIPKEQQNFAVICLTCNTVYGVEK